MLGSRLNTKNRVSLKTSVLTIVIHTAVTDIYQTRPHDPEHPYPTYDLRLVAKSKFENLK